MEIIVFSSPDFLPNEIEIIHQLFENGLFTFHLRKPDLDANQLEAFVKQIHSKYYKRIVLHSHFDLLKKYNFKGIHLTETARNQYASNDLKKTIKKLQNKGLSISTGFHSLEQFIQNASFNYDYVFLSPIFDSISKNGYQSKFNIEELKEFLVENAGIKNICALGGVDISTIPKIKELNFKKAAILGAIWQAEYRLLQFKEIQNIANAP
jgi:thiamine-phosphate pyrophosphorylase